jgi:ADP-ribosylglycohydrolase
MSDLNTRAQACLRMAFVADSLTMPAHWYYNTRHLDAALPQGCGTLQPAPEHHPDAIMSLHATNAGGRRALGAKGKDVVGDVILKGRAQYWNRPGLHYHHGMQTGENTLNAHCALWLLETLAGHGGEYKAQAFLQRYETEMTAEPPDHPDTYAESFHRAFFANREQGKPLAQCAGVTHDTPSVGGLVMIGPLVLAGVLQKQPVANIQANARQQLALTHPDDSLAQVCNRYVALMTQLLALSEDDSESARAAILQACPSDRRRDVESWAKSSIPVRQVIGQKLSSACYIRDAWPAVLFLTLRFLEQPLQALQENAEAGGDNVHRGWVLASILAAIQGDFANELYTRLALCPRVNDALASLNGAASN